MLSIHVAYTFCQFSAMTRHILIIDDELDIQAVAQLALQTVAGWKVSTASSGAEGITIARSGNLDAILLDVMMPDMDGIMTLQALQSNPDTQFIPVILMTAKTQVSDRERFAKLGISGLISKPFKAMLLADQISGTLDWQVGGANLDVGI
jgi:two-component system, OmpR family, alkaline phosphatase synthesis response regulator PhoP